MGIHIVTDSSCDLPEEILASRQITVVPLTVRIDGKEYFEGVTLSAKAFAQKLSSAHELPQTSQPSPQAFLNAFEDVLRKKGQAAEVLCITLSSKLSGTFQSAITAQKLFKGNVTVVDSLSGTLGLGLQALHAVNLAKAEHSMNELVMRLHALRERMSVLVGVDSLENAVKGGRVKRVHAAVAQVLRMKILLHTVEGRVEVCGKVRGKGNVLNAFLDAMEAKGEIFHKRVIGITHVDNEIDATTLANAIRQRFSPQEIIITPMGSTIATYAGSGAIALAY